MSSSETSYERELFVSAARCGFLHKVIELSSQYGEYVSEALTGSCERGQMDVVQWLVRHTGANVNYNSKGWSPLTAACTNDHLDIVKYLIEIRYADVNLLDSKGDTALTRACRNSSHSVLMFLLCEVSDLDVNIADGHGNTALHITVWCSKDDNTRLHEVCKRGNITEVLRLVHVSGHRINIQNNDGDTPLHFACYYGYSDVVATLMLAEADETITNDGGKTPAQVAERGRHKELVKLVDRDNLWLEIERQSKLKKWSIVVRKMWSLQLVSEERYHRNYVLQDTLLRHYRIINERKQRMRQTIVTSMFTLDYTTFDYSTLDHFNHL